MRFRKRLKVFPGFYLNLSKSGISSTLGVNGASINFSKKGTYLNTGIPGTGIYDRQRIGGEQNSSNSFSNNPNNFENQIVNNQEILVGEIKSDEIDKLTSTSLIELKETLLEVYNDHIELKEEIETIKKQIKSAKTNFIVARIFIIGFVMKSFKDSINDKEEYLIDIENQLRESYINIDINFDKEYEGKYIDTLNSYKSLLTSEIIWDITSSVQQDMKATRSAASSVITRKPVKFKFDNIDIIKSTYSAFHIENKNGGDLYIYPAFVIVSNNKKEFGLIDIKEFEMKFSQQQFIEQEKIPSDTKIIDKTWAKVNKNGSPDKRFVGNYEIPIVSYGKIDFTSKSGLNETYAFSNYEKSKEFVDVFFEYQKSL
jgi:hypothetical protein